MEKDKHPVYGETTPAEGKHWMLYGDYRMRSLEFILEGLKHSREMLSNKDWHSIGLIDPSDIEFYFGIELLALQNYLIQTTNDLNKIFKVEGTVESHMYNEHSSKIHGYQYNKIQLIHACANYFKHKDGKLYDHILNVLIDFRLYTEQKHKDDEYYLLTEAYDLINPTYKMQSILDLLSEWRRDVICFLEE